jgi:type I restriction enzyme M protein
MNDKYKNLEENLWQAANQLWSNANLKPSERTQPVLGLIFLKFADVLFTKASKKLQENNKSGRREISKVDYQAKGVLYLPEKARYSYLINLTESHDIAQAIEDAMKLIEDENEKAEMVLPRGYKKIDNSLLLTLLKQFNAIPDDIEGDVFGRIYEYFLGNFASSEGQKGGEFFTPTSLVKLIVEIIEPYSGKILDPACGSGGMFVQSAKFVKQHKKDPTKELRIFGQELVTQNVNIAKMNLAINGLEGKIMQGNTYKEDLHNSVGSFDYVMANPPFNGKGVDKDTIKDNPRFKFGMPSTDNANYLWIQIFYSALNETGRAGFVMANSASDARHSEMEIRKKIIEERVVDVIVSVGPNFFYTVTLPCTLWFLDKGKKQTDRKDKVLFLDAKKFFTQIDRAHREFTQEQIYFLSDIVRMYRDDEPEHPENPLFKENFDKPKYKDIKGVCKIATIEEIKEQGYSLNPGRYVGVNDKPQDDFDFEVRFQELNEELEILNAEAHKLEEQISNNAKKLLGINGNE